MGLALTIAGWLAFMALASYVGERWGLLYFAILVLGSSYGIGWLFDSGVLAG